MAISLTQSIWNELLLQRDALAGKPLAALFAQDPQRFAALSRSADDLLLDLSKQRLTREIVIGLCAFAEASGFGPARERLFGAKVVNVSEDRPALHWALRLQSDRRVLVGGVDVVPAIRAVQARMRGIADAIGAGAWPGARGTPIDTVVHLGIGGSDLGPRMAVHALAEDRVAGIAVHFVSNVDPAQLGRVLPGLDPARTLLIVCSKSFRTPETLANAQAARDWLRKRLGAGADLSRHIVAVTANVPAARAFGIAEDNILPMWDWVGGRFSLWSAVGLPVAIAAGWERFAEMLAGAARMDAHFATAPAIGNLPLLLALVDFWNVNALRVTQRVTAPYSSALDLFALYVQQVEMESNGKSVAADGGATPWTTTPGVWGAAGTDSQHSFFQWLHQGNIAANVELIVPVASRHGDRARQDILLANALAQAQALLAGRTREEVEAEMLAQGADAATIERVAPHRVFGGDRTSTTLLLPGVNAFRLGQLCALYEHKAFCFGVLAGINSFDQWGVELGKTLAVGVEAALTGGALPPDADASTVGLIEAIRAMRAV
ncbi:MAG: glucose-6-phosphate isomerase [Burkholderiales bacterium]|nr:glucose-6-phosphate isomerase [Burkholderiales bacterium]